MARPGTTPQQPVLLWNGRIPQAWDLPGLRKTLAHSERLTIAPDPSIAAYYRARVSELRAVIKQTEKECADVHA
jgi:hypothetical protein